MSLCVSLENKWDTYHPFLSVNQGIQVAVAKVKPEKNRKYQER